MSDIKSDYVALIWTFQEQKGLIWEALKKVIK